MPPLRPSLALFTLMALAASALPGAAQQSAEAMEGDLQTPVMPMEELHMRSGIMLLASLYEVLARVEDFNSAQAAAPEVTRISRELHSWAQGVSALPPLGDKELRAYERRYLPAIRRVNDHLRAQGERLAASDYYGSQDLATALISLYSMAQQ